MSERVATSRFPQLPLLGAGALVGLALLAAVAGRFAHTGNVAADSPMAAMRDIRVADAPDGAVLVFDAGSGAQIERLSGENGFLRGTLRALARERRIDGVGREQAFRLTAWADGRLTLDDPATGRRLELEAFGPDNAAVFARFLPARHS